MRQKGMSLLDLLITLAIAGSLLFGATALSSNISQSARLDSTAENMQTSLMLARTKAITTNQNVVMRNKGDWSTGWTIFVDKNDNSTLEEDEEVIVDQTLTQRAIIKSSSKLTAQYVSYNGNGESRLASPYKYLGAFQATTFSICTKADSPKSTVTKLILSRGGRVRKQQSREDSSKCS